MTPTTEATRKLRRPPLTPAEMESIRRDRAADVKLLALAVRHGVSTSTIWKIEMGILPKSGRRRSTPCRG